MTQTTSPIPPVSPLAIEPQPVPRLLTARARRRSWGEASVRPWWLIAVALFLIMLYFLTVQTIAALRDRHLVRDGIEVTAEILEVDRNPIKALYVAEEHHVFKLRYMQPGTGDSGTVAEGKITPTSFDAAADLPQKLPYKDTFLQVTSGKLSGQARQVASYDPVSHLIELQTPLPAIPAPGTTFRIGCQPIIVIDELKAQMEPTGPGRMLTLRVDPDDPTHWTDRQWVSLGDMSFSLALLPLVGILFLTAWTVRGRLLRIWRDGQAMVAIVVDTRQAASAPRSRLVRYTLRDSPGQKILSALVPAALGELQPGQTFWVVASPQNQRRAVVAGLYA